MNTPFTDDEFVICPSCGQETMHITDEYTARPEVIVVTYTCTSCGHTDVDAID